jgi:NurA-like 5'-3' nuclease
VIRRFSELATAKELVKNLEKDDIIVLDGSLEAKYTYESNILDELNMIASEKNISLCGFSKTCELLTDKGNSIIAALSDIQPDKEWYYHPIARIYDEKYDIFFAKLNKMSDYIFRVDISDKNFETIFNLLRQNSKDPVFLGYPYSLVEADKFARISNKELELLKTQFMAGFGKDWNKISVFLKTKNSHEILDKAA